MCQLELNCKKLHVKIEIPWNSGAISLFYYVFQIFSLENVLRLGIPDFKLRQQLPSGFQKNIACVGNDFAYDQGACEGDSGSPVIRRVSDTAK